MNKLVAFDEHHHILIVPRNIGMASVKSVHVCMLSETGNWQAVVDFQSRKIGHTFHHTSEGSWDRVTTPQVFTCSFN
jgi:hypothetical protein